MGCSPLCDAKRDSKFDYKSRLRRVGTHTFTTSKVCRVHQVKKVERRKRTLKWKWDRQSKQRGRDIETE